MRTIFLAETADDQDQKLLELEKTKHGEKERGK